MTTTKRDKMTEAMFDPIDIDSPWAQYGPNGGGLVINWYAAGGYWALALRERGVGFYTSSPAEAESGPRCGSCLYLKPFYDNKIHGCMRAQPELTDESVPSGQSQFWTYLYACSKYEADDR